MMSPPIDRVVSQQRRRQSFSKERFGETKTSRNAQKPLMYRTRHQLILRYSFQHISADLVGRRLYESLKYLASRINFSPNAPHSVEFTVHCAQPCESASCQAGNLYKNVAE